MGDAIGPGHPILSKDPEEARRPDSATEREAPMAMALVVYWLHAFGECALHWATVGYSQLATLGHNGADASGCNMRLSCDRRQEHNIHYTAIDCRSGPATRTHTIVNAIWRSLLPGSKHWAGAAIWNSMPHLPHELENTEAFGKVFVQSMITGYSSWGDNLRKSV